MLFILSPFLLLPSPLFLASFLSSSLLLLPFLFFSFFFFFFFPPPPPSSTLLFTLFPYPPLFRSLIFPIEITKPHSNWLAKAQMSHVSNLPKAKFIHFQSLSSFDSFYPMEVVATDKEKQELIAENVGKIGRAHV